MLGALMALSVPFACAGTAHEGPISWADHPLHGKALTLIDERRVQKLSFRANGMVVAVIGSIDGPLTGPILYWRFRGDRMTVSRDSNGEDVFDVLTLRSWAADVVTVQRLSGQIDRFRASRVSQ